jgi:hypothetical protein
MLKTLHHDAVIAPAVPSFAIVFAGAEMLPESFLGFAADARRHRIVQHDVTVLIPESEVGGR